MKLNNIKRQAGLTLIEVTLVIAVLLGLISVLFIGVGAYKEGADRSKCIMIISSVQKAVRSHQNLYELELGDDLAIGDIVGDRKMLEIEPGCPSDGTYTFGEVVPAVSVAYVGCSATGHVPKDTTGW